MKDYKMSYYKQCRLEKDNTHTVSWIPEEFAVLNKVLKLKNSKGEWVDGWIVKSVSNHKITSEEARLNSHNSKDIWTATSGPCPRGKK